MAAVSDMLAPSYRAEVLLFDTNSVPNINHPQTDLRNAVGEPD